MEIRILSGDDAAQSAGRARFVARFGETAAAVIEKAAAEHRDPYVLDERGPGSDGFRWAILICIGHQCMSDDWYREWHHFEPPWAEVRAWLREPEQEAWIDAHDGDFDVLAAFAGMYDEILPKKKGATNG